MAKIIEKLGIEIPQITAEEINDQVKPVLRQMEKAGIKLDCDVLKKLDQKLSLRLLSLEEEIFKLAGREFNLGSPSQMAEVLFRELKLPTEGLKRTKSGVSTAASELAKVSDKSVIIAPILEHRELSKLINTYLRPLPVLVDENSRLHTTYGMETSTGRITSSEPNLQNIPIRGTYGAEMRSAFVAEKGMKLISADYSQIELRVVACLAKDAVMIEAFHAKVDIHTKTAAEIFNTSVDKVTADQRRVAKAVNFGIVYGQTPYGLSQAIKISTEDAAKYIREYFDVHTGIKNYISEMIEMAHREGFVETLFGTRRYLPNINSHMRFIAEAEERMAINMPVQGTAAEILKLAMIELDKKLSTKNYRLKTSLLLTVHDELVVETPAETVDEVAKIVKETMEGVVKLCVPIEVSLGIGDNWDQSK
ncbi:MAG: DNA polymerase [Candidatus Berkelbacteria bacterium]|nr:DNA polymerase [Candidatus Berkelbacteria bacterium]